MTRPHVHRSISQMPFQAVQQLHILTMLLQRSCPILCVHGRTDLCILQMFNYEHRIALKFETLYSAWASGLKSANKCIEIILWPGYIFSLFSMGCDIIIN